MEKIKKLDERIYLLDGFDMAFAERTGSYLLLEEDITLIETGPSPSVNHIKEALTTLGIGLEEIKYIIVTHIHLDHAGGSGLLLKDCPQAMLVVHPRGERHLVDPTKLIAGAKAIYGEHFSNLFDPVIPVPKERILVRGEGDELKIGPHRVLEFFDTPGHARHHFSIYDPVSKGIFTGDTAGIRYAPLARDGIDFYLPSTSPNHFDPEEMKASISRLRKLPLERIYFGHFGMTEKPYSALQEVDQWIDIFMEIAKESFEKSQGDYKDLAKRLFERVRKTLQNLGVKDDHKVYSMLKLDMEINALGIMDYLKRQNRDQK